MIGEEGRNPVYVSSSSGYKVRTWETEQKIFSLDYKILFTKTRRQGHSELSAAFFLVQPEEERTIGTKKIKKMYCCQFPHNWRT